MKSSINPKTSINNFITSFGSRKVDHYYTMAEINLPDCIFATQHLPRFLLNNLKEMDYEIVPYQEISYNSENRLLREISYW